jgi:SAM-dependent methyltransferase
MQAELLDALACPRCHAERSFRLDVREEDEREVRAGELTCAACGHRAEVEDGIVDLLHDPPDYVTREARGLAQFAERMRADGWDRERVLRLPYEQSGYWFHQVAAIERLFEAMTFEPGATLLDVGANTCWASNIFAERGLRVTALDISAIELQGLRTADWWFDAKGVYFDRVLSVMFDPALASETFDYVFCCEVLHHNHEENLRRTLRELHRVLKPGGKLIVVNEPLRFPTNRKRDHAAEVAEYEGHEHVYYLHEYLLAARRAGFRVRIMRPNTTQFFRMEPFKLYVTDGPVLTAKKFAKHLIRRNDRARQAFTLYKLAVGTEDLSLSMLCVKDRARGACAPAAADRA